MKKKTFVVGLVFLLVFIGALLFIKWNNDHLECVQTVEQHRDTRGNLVLEKRHVCREKFSF